MSPLVKIEFHRISQNSFGSTQCMIFLMIPQWYSIWRTCCFLANKVILLFIAISSTSKFFILEVPSCFFLLFRSESHDFWSL